MKLINVIKPTHICNLNCDYCFNDDVRQPIMDLAVLSRTIEETFKYARNNPGFTGIEFIWHGGEPLVAGIEYFQEAIKFQKSFSNGMSYTNSIQTNGLLLTEVWAFFFRENTFSISLSLDGIGVVHDRYRKDHAGKGSFDKVMSAIALLRNCGINPGVVLVATAAMKGLAETIYRFLVKNDLNFQMVALTKSGNAREIYDEIALTQVEYAELWMELFDLWFDSSNGHVKCQEFEGRLSAVISGYPYGCEGLASCADTNISTDPVGDIYSCATLSGTTTLAYGNIASLGLESLMLTDTAVHFRTRQVDPQCAACHWEHICHGGCMSRAYKMFESIDVRDSGCDALWRTWEHISKRVKQMRLTVSDPQLDHLHDQFSIPAHYFKKRYPLKRVISIKASND